MVQFEFNREDARTQSNAKDTRSDSRLAYHCVLASLRSTRSQYSNFTITEISQSEILNRIWLPLPHYAA